MERSKPESLSLLIFIPLSALIFIRPFFSDLAYPIFEAYYQNCAIFLAIITLFISPRNKNIYNLPILVLLLSYGLSAFASIDIQNSIKETIKFISYIAIFIIVLYLDDKQKTILIKTIVIAASIISIYSIYQFFWGYEHTLEYLKKIDRAFLSTSSYARDILIARRAIGTFPSPTLLGGYLMVTFFLSLSLIKNNTLYWRAAPILIILALILTKSMGVWLSLIVCLSILFMLLYKSFKKQKMLFIASFILIAVVLTFIIINRWDRLINLENPQNSITQRLNYWRTAIAVIKERPFLGVGPGNFQEVYLNYKVGMSTDTRYAHNIFLHQWSETGMLGFIGIIFLFVAFIKKSILTSRYIFLAGLVFILHNLIDNTYFIPQTGFLWWVIIGLLPSDRFNNELNSRQSLPS